MYDLENVFAKILRGEIPCKEVYQDEVCLAFHDAYPKAAVHVLVIPKDEVVSFSDFAQLGAERVGAFFRAVQQVVAELGLEEDGYRLVTNHGQDANQEVPHFHVHILGGQNLGGLLP